MLTVAIRREVACGQASVGASRYDPRQRICCGFTVTKGMGFMARRRAFFAELQHQGKLAEKRSAQQQATLHRARQLAIAEAQRALRDAESAQAQASRYASADRKAAEAQTKAAEAEALRLHRSARKAEVEAMNAELAMALDQVGAIL